MEKHRDMEGEGKGDGYQHGRKLRIPKPVLIAWKLTLWGSEGTLDTYGHWAHGATDGRTWYFNICFIFFSNFIWF